MIRRYTTADLDAVEECSGSQESASYRIRGGGDAEAAEPEEESKSVAGLGYEESSICEIKQSDPNSLGTNCRVINTI